MFAELLMCARAVLAAAASAFARRISPTDSTAALRQKQPLRNSAGRDCVIGRGHPSVRAPGSRKQHLGRSSERPSWRIHPVATETRAVADWGPPGAILGGYTGKSERAVRPYFTGLSRSCFKVAEREGLPRYLNKINKINSLLIARATRVYQCCAPSRALRSACRTQGKPP
jgi:hypothetical protein